jgi:hypothetical protein
MKLEDKMKGYYKIVVLFVLLDLVLTAFVVAQPAESSSIVLLYMSWDHIVEEAYAE